MSAVVIMSLVPPQTPDFSHVSGNESYESDVYVKPRNVVYYT